MREERILFFDDKEESKKACQTVLKYQISCRFVCASDKKTPLLIIGDAKFQGIKKIRKFARRWFKEEKRKLELRRQK